MHSNLLAPNTLFNLSILEEFKSFPLFVDKYEKNLNRNNRGVLGMYKINKKKCF